MKKLGFLLLILCLRFSASGQVNLVPNPSFETVTQCGGISQIYYAAPWFQPNIWQGNTTNSSTSDLFDTCVNYSTAGVPINQCGNQNARTGIGYAGIFVYGDTFNYREYLEVPLVSPLIANRHYCVEFYVSLAEMSYFAISNFAAYFSQDSLLISSAYNHTIDTVTPQIENSVGNMLASKTAWMQVSGNFIATGGERFMTIGNFHLPVNTNVQPVTGGSYAGAGYYFIDDVSVVDCLDEETNNLTNNQPSTIEISPNPATSEIKITTTNAVIKEAHIYTMMGQCIHQSTINNRQSTIDISSLPSGMYIAEVISEKGVIRKRFVKE